MISVKTSAETLRESHQAWLVAMDIIMANRYYVFECVVMPKIRSSYSFELKRWKFSKVVGYSKVIAVIVKGGHHARTTIL